MKIQAPLAGIKEIKELSIAGADEFYCGYMPEEWIGKYGFEIPLNCRSTYPNANFYNEFEFRECLKIAHNYGKQMLLTLNENSYSSEQMKYIINLVEKLSVYGIDGIIVSSMALINEINEKKIPIKVCLSGEANCINSHAVQFYKNLGVKRIIYPRHISIKEMKSISQNHPELEYEAFGLNEGCFFNGGHCYSIHYNKFSQMCRTLNFKLKANNKKNKNEIEKIRRDSEIKKRLEIPKNKFNGSKITKCGLCSIKLLNDSSVSVFKIVGRTASMEDKLKWIQISKKAIELSENNSYDEYKKICTETFFGNDKDKFCDRRIFCYYPNEFVSEDIL